MQTITDTLVERTPNSPLILPGERTTEKTVGGLVVLLITLVLLPRMVFSVDPGEAGVVWDRFFGTRVDTVYGEGVHVIFPWNRFYKYDVRLQSVTSEYDALAQTGLPIKVSASVRYRLAGAPFKYVVNRGASTEYSLGELHRRIGPDYRDKVVLPLVGAALRQVIGHYGAEDLYRIQRAAIQDEIVEVIAQRRRKEQFADERTIDVIDVLIRSITLPAPVQQAIENKMAAEQAMLAYDFTIGKEKKEVERKSVEAEGIRRFQEIVTRQGIDLRYLQLRGIEATLELAKSPNAKIVVIGSKDGLPVIVNPADTGATAPAVTTPPK
jgi:regulator of protease activity HflC (stomatin/prohibitin superfamily)